MQEQDIKFVDPCTFASYYSRDSFLGTLKTRLSRRLIVPLTPTTEKPLGASTNCDNTAVTAIDSTDQSNASPQTSPIRWEPLQRTDKRVPTVYKKLFLTFHFRNTDSINPYRNMYVFQN